MQGFTSRHIVYINPPYIFDMNCYQVVSDGIRPQLGALKSLYVHAERRKAVLDSTEQFKHLRGAYIQFTPPSEFMRA